MASNCESCVNYVYDDEMECYCCDMNLDEDDMVKFLTTVRIIVWMMNMQW